MNPTPPQSEREKLVGKLIYWFDEQAPTVNIDWRRSAENLADFILAEKAEAEIVGTKALSDAIRWNAHNMYGSDSAEEALNILEDGLERVAALTPETTKENI